MPTGDTTHKPGAYLERLRCDAGLSRPELATRIGYTRAHLWWVETGKGKPGERLIWALADVYDIRRAELADRLRREAQDCLDAAS